MTLKDYIKSYREAQSMSQRQFALKCGLSNGYISMLENGTNPKTKLPIVPTLPVLKKLADGMNISVDNLISSVDDMPVTLPKIEPDTDVMPFPEKNFPDNITLLPHMREWQVLGATACGKPLHRELLEETVLAPDDIKADIVFRCVGDSMINARIFDGDAVFVRIQPEVENGQIAVVRIGDEYTLKRVYVHSDYVELRPENPLYQALTLRGEEELDPVNFEIVGLAVAFLSAIS